MRAGRITGAMITGAMITGALAGALTGCAKEPVQTSGSADVRGSVRLFQSFFPVVSLDISGTDPGGVHMEWTLRWDIDEPEISLEVDESNGVATASIDCHLNNVCEATVTAMVPATAAVSADALYGQVTLADTSGAAEIALQTGDIRLERLAGNVEIGVETGDVTGTDLACPGLYVGGRAGARTIHYAQTPLSVDLRTLSGDIGLEVPAGNYAVETSAGGAVTVEGLADDPTQTHTIGAVTEDGDISIVGY